MQRHPKGGRAPHIAVIGAGLAGASLAWAAHARGARITVFEQDRIASGASGAAAGMLQPLIGMRLTYRQQNVDDVALTRRLATSLLDEGTTWRPCGVLRLPRDEKQARRWHERLQEVPTQVAQWKDAALLQKMEPRLQDGFPGGVWIPDGCMIDVPAFIRALLKHADAAVREQHRVRALEEDADGVALWMEAQEAPEVFDAVVIASGAQAPHPVHDPQIDMSPYLGIMARFKDVPLPAVAWSHRGYITAWKDDSLLVGTVDRRHGFDAEPTPQSVEELHERLHAVLKLERPPRLVEVWKGLRPALPERKPIAQRATGYARVWVFTGFGGRGLMVGPRMAQQLAEEILG